MLIGPYLHDVMLHVMLLYCHVMRDNRMVRLLLRFRNLELSIEPYSSNFSRFSWIAIDLRN